MHDESEAKNPAATPNNETTAASHVLKRARVVNAGRTPFRGVAEPPSVNADERLW